MALGLNLSKTQFGIAFDQCYGRIATASVNRQRTDQGGLKFNVMVDVTIYATVPTDETHAVDFKRIYIPYEQTSGDFLEWVYTKLKALPDFTGSTDI